MTTEERDTLVIVARLVSQLAEVINSCDSTRLMDLADKIEKDAKPNAQ